MDDCGSGTLVAKVVCILTYGGCALDICINYALLLLDVAFCKLWLTVSHQPTYCSAFDFVHCGDVLPSGIMFVSWVFWCVHCVVRCHGLVYPEVQMPIGKCFIANPTFSRESGCGIEGGNHPFVAECISAYLLCNYLRDDYKCGSWLRAVAGNGIVTVGIMLWMLL